MPVAAICVVIVAFKKVRRPTDTLLLFHLVQDSLHGPVTLTASY